MNDPASPNPLQNLLDELQAQVAPNPVLPGSVSHQPDSKTLAAELEALYHLLKQAFDRCQFTSAQQSYLTEFHKQMRLLGTDIVFLKSARQAATREQRLASIRDRLQALQRYYSAMVIPGDS